MTDAETRDILDVITSAVHMPPMEGRASIFWQERLARLDVTIATKTVLIGSSTWRRFPSWAEFYEVYTAQHKLHDPERLYRAPDGQPDPVPLWIKRYCAARYLHARFFREQDMRMFPEQLEGLRNLRAFHGGGERAGYPDPPELMPENEWIEEAKRLSDTEIRRVFAEPEARGDFDLVKILKETAPRPRAEA